MPSAAPRPAPFTSPVHRERLPVLGADHGESGGTRIDQSGGCGGRPRDHRVRAGGWQLGLRAPKTSPFLTCNVAQARVPAASALMPTPAFDTMSQPRIGVETS